MALGKTFKEAFQKAIRSLETDRCGIISLSSLDHFLPGDQVSSEIQQQIEQNVRVPHPDRPWQIADALRLGISKDELYATTHIDPWFLDQLDDILECERNLLQKVRATKSKGPSDPVHIFSGN